MQVSSSTFEVYSDICPGGYGIKNVSTLGVKCYCLDQTIDKIVHCEDDQESIIVQVSGRISEDSSSC